MFPKDSRIKNVSLDNILFSLVLLPQRNASMIYKWLIGNKQTSEKLGNVSFLGMFYVIFCGLDPTFFLSGYVAEPE